MLIGDSPVPQACRQRFDPRSGTRQIETPADRIGVVGDHQGQDVLQAGIDHGRHEKVIQGVLHGPVPAPLVLAGKGLSRRRVPVEMEGFDQIDGDAMLDQAPHRGYALAEGDEDRRRRGGFIEDETAHGALQVDEVAWPHLVAEEGLGKGVARPAPDQKLEVARIAGTTGDGEFGAGAILQPQQGALAGHEAEGVGAGGLGSGRPSVSGHHLLLRTEAGSPAGRLIDTQGPPPPAPGP